MKPTELLRNTKSFQKLLKCWSDSNTKDLHWGGLWGSSKALLTATLEMPLLVITANSHEAEIAVDDLESFGKNALMFPAREGAQSVEPRVLKDRQQTFDLINRQGFTGIAVAPIQALIQPIPSRDTSEQTISLQTGTSLSQETLMKRLVGANFRRVPAITEPGEFARRGDIVDIFAPAMHEPIRLEFFDDEIESLRVFDLKTQRTKHILQSTNIPLIHDLPEIANSTDTILLENIPHNMRCLSWGTTLLDQAKKNLLNKGNAYAEALKRTEKIIRCKFHLTLSSMPSDQGNTNTLSIEEYCQGVSTGIDILAKRSSQGEQVLVFCSTPAELSRLKQIISDNGHRKNELKNKVASLSKGFRIPEARLTIINHREFIPGHNGYQPKPKGLSSQASHPLTDIQSLTVGDLVVHAVHGVACFRGMDISENNKQGFLLLEFREESMLRVPASRIDMVERYIGSGGATPPLDRLGSGQFLKRRKQVAEAIEDFAGEMLDVQAKREAIPSNPYPPIGEDERLFEASFPWEDTPDQAEATQAIHADLSLPKAMDRLLCGDVGYGKTEVAARAAFRAINAGLQVAILVPTTVLAEQHTRSFKQRLGNWPIEVEQLSRLIKPSQTKEIVRAIERGKVDLIIGTHRLLSKDVKFSNLGLVIIDEEQRFGVKHKELLKKKREQVDVLTLSATPVPRTLNMALAGIRDITALHTPPIGRRNVHTEIKYDDEHHVISEALSREIDRGGQAFFVHNRVKTLEKVAQKLRNINPNLRIVTGHGQMNPEELEKTMLTFVRGEADVLCSTTIIESGLDIPNANTIFIDGAHRYGLADLHQLRGRIGRATKKGWCYMLIPRGQPLSLDARRRLKAVEELRYLGAGFQIAMRDLEIRGAGNLLGPEQSGHIAAVGYETYRKLLRVAASRLKKEKQLQDNEKSVANISINIEASLDPEYIADEGIRLAVLREFDAIRLPQEIDKAINDLKDRFGDPPEAVHNLAQLFFLKHRLGSCGIVGIQRIENHLLCRIAEAKQITNMLDKKNIDLRVISPRRAHWMLPKTAMNSKAVLQYLFEAALSCHFPDNIKNHG